jgi:hypothetical protein
LKLLDERKDDTPIMPVDDPVWLDQGGNVTTLQRAQQNSIKLSFQEKRSADWSILSLPAGNPW